MALTFKLTGFKELGRALDELPKTVARAVGVRALKKAAVPLHAHMKSAAPDDPETQGFDLKKSIVIGTKLNKTNRKAIRRNGDKTFSQVFVGTNDPAGVQQEFGNVHNAAQPFGRPAWDAEKMNVLDILGKELGKEIIAGAKRLGRNQKATNEAKAGGLRAIDIVEGIEGGDV